MEGDENGETKCIELLNILQKDFAFAPIASVEQKKTTENDSLSSPNSLHLLRKYSNVFDTHDRLVGLLKSLQAREYISTFSLEKTSWVLTSEGESYCNNGTPEFRLYQWLQESSKSQGIDVDSLKKGFGSECNVAMANAMKQGWIVSEKATKKISINESIGNVSDGIKVLLDIVRAHQILDAESESCIESELLQKIEKASPGKSPATILNDMKRRKLVETKKTKFFSIFPGTQFSNTLSKPITDINAKLLQDDAWKKAYLKPYNFFASGKHLRRGSSHPLMRVMKQFKQILMAMGFDEMETNQYAENSFWCFDSLFMPQQHPARDIQDTFFLKNPESSNMDKMPKDYVARVQEMHERGGSGSIGWRYDWSEADSMKNILRTHTTATSSRLLYEFAQEYKKTGVLRPRRLFSIDRVFRNETLDATHLAEFHQVEGLVMAPDLSLGDLIGVLTTFYNAIGIEKLKFKAAYNPYTEPSMEIFGYHPGLQKWIEVGNSGVFRPEMLLPMGLPPDVTVIAWGLSLERPTMIKYGIMNIRQLFGHKAHLGLFT